MKKWKHELDISKDYTQYEQDLDFKKYAVAVIALLEASGAVDDCFIQQLRDARDSEDIDEWDEAMEDLYNFADENGIWVRVI